MTTTELAPEPVRVDLAALLPPLPVGELEGLRTSIQQQGVVVPVVVDQTGRVIDGHNRSRIARELGVGFKTTLCEIRDDDHAVEVAFSLNSARRGRLTKAQRGEVIDRLRSEPYRWSNVRIATALGVDESTVRAWPTSGNPEVGDSSSRRIDRAGRSIPARPATRAEILRRQATAVDMREQGHRTVVIAKALGVSTSTVDDDLKAARANLTKPTAITDRPEVLYRTRRFDHNRIIEQTVRRVEHVDSLLDEVDYSALDRDRLGEWVSSLSESIDALRSLKNTLERELNRVRV